MITGYYKIIDKLDSPWTGAISDALATSDFSVKNDGSMDISNWRECTIYTFVGDPLISSPTFSYKVYLKPKPASQWIFCTAQSFSTAYWSSSSKGLSANRCILNNLDADQMMIRYSVSSTSGVSGISIPVRCEVYGKTY